MLRAAAAAAAAARSGLLSGRPSSRNRDSTLRSSAHGPLGALGVAAEPEQIVGGAAEQVAAGPAQMHLAHGRAQDAGLLALRTGGGDPQVLAAEAVGQHGGGRARRRGGRGRRAGSGSRPRRPRRRCAARRGPARSRSPSNDRGGGQRHRLDRHPAMRPRWRAAPRASGGRRGAAAPAAASATGSPGSLRAMASTTAQRSGCAQRPRRVPRIAQPQRCARPASSGASPRTRRNSVAANGASAWFCTTPLPEPVDHGDVAAARRLHQPRDTGEAAARQVQRVHEMAGLLADDEIDPLQAVQRLQVELVVADGEVAALDHGVAEIAGEIGVAEIGRARPAPGSGSRSGRRRAGTAPGSSPAGPGSSRPAAGCGSRGTARPGRGSAPRGWPARSRCRSRCRSGRPAPPTRRRAVRATSQA